MENLQGSLPLEHVVALLKACDRSSWTGIRNRAIISVSVDTGLRLGELIGLDVADVDSTTARALRKWEAVRGYGPAHAPLFVTRDGARLTRRNVQRVLERLAKKTGLDGVKVSPHRLRHTAATLFISSGGPLPALKELLGHSSLRSTEIYLHMAGSLQEIQTMASPADRWLGR